MGKRLSLLLLGLLVGVGVWLGWRSWLPSVSGGAYVIKTHQEMGSNKATSWPVGKIRGRYVGLSEKEERVVMKLVYRDAGDKPRFVNVVLGGDLEGENLELVAVIRGEEVIWPGSVDELKNLVSWGEGLELDIVLEPTGVSELLFEEFCKLEVRKRMCQVVGYGRRVGKAYDEFVGTGVMTAEVFVVPMNVRLGGW